MEDDSNDSRDLSHYDPELTKLLTRNMADGGFARRIAGIAHGDEPTHTNVLPVRSSESLSDIASRLMWAETEAPRTVFVVYDEDDEVEIMLEIKLR